jgi:mono/diheme cytochrome c family protein
VISRTHRALIAVAAGLLALPVLAASAAPKKPAKPAAGKGDPKAGLVAFKNEGCGGCHKTKDNPDAAGPDFSTIGATKKPAEIAAYARKPKAGSTMPAFKGPQKTLDNIVAYLMTQK